MRPRIAVLLGLLALLVSTAAAAQQRQHFEATLSGSEEVPPNMSEATGRAELRVSADRATIRFRLEARHVEDALAIAGAHVHCAPPGVNGPVVAFLAGQVAGGFDGRFTTSGTLTDANLVNTSCGATIAALAESMASGMTYVNVHSTAYPGGLIRGQLVLEGEDEEADGEDDS